MCDDSYLAQSHAHTHAHTLPFVNSKHLHTHQSKVSQLDFSVCAVKNVCGLEAARGIGWGDEGRMEANEGGKRADGGEIINGHHIKEHISTASHQALKPAST